MDPMMGYNKASKNRGIFRIYGWNEISLKNPNPKKHAWDLNYPNRDPVQFLYVASPTQVFWVTFWGGELTPTQTSKGMKKVNFESPEFFFGSTGHPSFWKHQFLLFFFLECKIRCTAGFLGDEFFCVFWTSSWRKLCEREEWWNMCKAIQGMRKIFYEKKKEHGQNHPEVQYHRKLFQLAQKMQDPVSSFSETTCSHERCPCLWGYTPQKPMIFKESCLQQIS